MALGSDGRCDQGVLVDLASSVTNKLPLDIGAGTTLKSADNMIETKMLSALSANGLVNKIEIDSTMSTSWATSAMVETQRKQSEILSSAVYPAMLIILDSKTLAVCKVIFHITDDMFATLRNAALLRIAAYP